MKFCYIFLILLCYSFDVCCQNDYSGQVLDKNTNTPIEFVDVFNSENYTITNEDGKFNFSSTKDSIQFNFLGYHPLKLTFKELPKNGMIYLHPKDFELDEVIISNKNTVYDKMVKTIRDDHKSRNFKEEFFLRAILKKDDTIIKLQDINGIIDRKTLFYTKENPLPKNNITVYLKEMRKAGYDIENINFVLSDLDFISRLIVTFNAPPDQFKHSCNILKDSSAIKLNYFNETKEVKTEGYYIIDPKTYHVQKAFWKRKQDMDFSKNGPLKYRTTDAAMMVNFYFTESDKSYRISNAKLNFKVEVFYKKNSPIIYDSTYIYKTVKNSTQLSYAENKTSVKKDIFKLKHPFDKKYWESTRHLKLTDEMKSFLKSLEHSEYDVKRNFKN